MKRYKQLNFLLLLTFSIIWLAGCAGWGQPTPTTVTPNRGPAEGGTEVTITGSKFKNGATVTIGGVAATNVTFVSKTELKATMPPGSLGAKDIVVTNPNNKSGTVPGGFTYEDLKAPAVSKVEPTDGQTFTPEDVANLTKISVEFDEAIVKDSVSISASMESLPEALKAHSGPVNGTIGYDSDTVVSFTPEKPFSAARKYTVTVSAAKDQAGNVIQDHTFSFSVNVPERVHWYTVKEGEDLKAVAARPETYDDEERWPWILEANQDDVIFDKSKLQPGMRIFIPWWEKLAKQ